MRARIAPPRSSEIAAVVAGAANAPAAPQGATSLLDAANAWQVRLTLASWQPIGTLFPIGNASDNFYGRGTLMVENISQQALTLYMPVGTLFPPATAGQQTMAGYTTNVQTSNPQPTQQQGQPSQLPNTAEGGQSPSLLLFGAALALLALGYWLRLRLTPR